MPNLKEVKNRISTVVSTQQITKAMKMVAASKLRRAQERIFQLRPYAQKLSEIQARVMQGVNQDFSARFSEERPVQKLVLVVVTSDRGLCGAFNSNVFRRVRKMLETELADFNRDNLLIMPIGKKAYDHYRTRKFNLIDGYWNMFSRLSFDEVKDAADFLLQGFQNREFDRVEIVYNEFKNVATQILRTEQFLPMKKLAESETEEVQDIDFIFEPDKDELLEMLIPYALKIQFYRNLLESNAAENGARMVAMDQATDNASELLKQLRLDYNRTRQAVITREILEIVAGAQALSND
jgi:F-type H+-transporting ATPase subunit gamma